MIKERFESRTQNKEGTRQCHCQCLNSDAVAVMTGEAVSDFMQPNVCNCTCWCSQHMANIQMNDDTSDASRDAT
jgi:hypothetical protein